MSSICPECGTQNESGAQFCSACGLKLSFWEATDGPDVLVGRVLAGRYRLFRVLDQGTMSKVYLAEQRMGTASRRVALKVLRVGFGSDPQVVARFHRECELVIALQHPNTIQFYDFGELPDGTLYIVMEYIDGPSLDQVLERGALRPDRVDRIVTQIGSSLHEAHSRGIIHRDLKPNNVLLTERAGQPDFVKVLDFGVAKRADSDWKRLTARGELVGTPPYMSPEQFENRPLDGRSDIYALAVMTYEMLTGALPFTASSPWDWRRCHLNEQPKPFETFPALPVLSAEKKNAVYKALAKNPADRQQTILQYLKELTGSKNAGAAWTLASLPHTISGATSAAASSGTSSPTLLLAEEVGAANLDSAPERSRRPVEEHASPVVPSPPAPRPMQREPRFTPPAAASTSIDPVELPSRGTGRVLGIAASGIAVLAATIALIYSLRPAQDHSVTQVSAATERVEKASVPVAVQPAKVTAPPTKQAPLPPSNEQNPSPTNGERGVLSSVHHVRNAVNAQQALGAPDQRYAEIGKFGLVTIDVGPSREFVTDRSGEPDLWVHIDDSRSSRYSVEVSHNHDDFFLIARQVSSSRAFDLDKFVPAARYVRIRNHSSNVPVYLDAVEVREIRPSKTVQDPHAPSPEPSKTR